MTRFEDNKRFKDWREKKLVYLDYSTIVAYDCPVRGFISHMCMGKGETTTALDFGSAVHAAIDDSLIRGNLSLSKLDEFRFTDTKRTYEMAASLVALAFEQYKHCTVVATDQRMKMHLCTEQIKDGSYINIIYTGVVDAILADLERNRKFIVDFKTASRTPVFATKSLDYQLRGYAELAHTFEAEFCFLVNTKIPKCIVMSPSLAALEDLKAAARNVVHIIDDAITSGRQGPGNRSLCDKWSRPCNYFDYCLTKDLACIATAGETHLDTTYED
jgi:hypothetical protein